MWGYVFLKKKADVGDTDISVNDFKRVLSQSGWKGHQQWNWGSCSLCHRLAVWPCHTSPAPAHVFLLQKHCPPFTNSGGEVHKPALNAMDPPGQGHCTCLSAHLNWWDFICLFFSRSSFAIGELCAKNPNQPGSTTHIPVRQWLLLKGCFVIQYSVELSSSFCTKDHFSFPFPGWVGPLLVFWASCWFAFSFTSIPGFT